MLSYNYRVNNIIRYILKSRFGLRRGRDFEETRNLDPKPYPDPDSPRNPVEVPRLITQRNYNNYK